jgi:hypothetical protein
MHKILNEKFGPLVGSKIMIMIWPEKYVIIGAKTGNKWMVAEALPLVANQQKIIDRAYIEAAIGGHLGIVQMMADLVNPCSYIYRQIRCVNMDIYRWIFDRRETIDLNFAYTCIMADRHGDKALYWLKKIRNVYIENLDNLAFVLEKSLATGAKVARRIVKYFPETITLIDQISVAIRTPEAALFVLQYFPDNYCIYSNIIRNGNEAAVKLVLDKIPAQLSHIAVSIVFNYNKAATRLVWKKIGIYSNRDHYMNLAAASGNATVFHMLRLEGGVAPLRHLVYGFMSAGNHRMLRIYLSRHKIGVEFLLESLVRCHNLRLIKVIYEFVDAEKRNFIIDKHLEAEDLDLAIRQYLESIRI